MLEKQISLAELEARLKDVTRISHATLSNCISGATAAPKADTFQWIATGLRVDLVELFCTEEQARILKEHLATVGSLRQEVTELRMLVEELQKASKSEAPESAPEVRPSKQTSRRKRRGEAADRSDHRAR